MIKDPQHIKEAFNLLLNLLPNVRLLIRPQYPMSILTKTLPSAWHGAARHTHGMQENPDLAYIYPQEGFPISLDCIAIPTNAQNPKNALTFINFLLRPDISVQLTIHTGGGTPNLTARGLLPNDIRNNPVINPSQEILKRGKFQLDFRRSKCDL